MSLYDHDGSYKPELTYACASGTCQAVGKSSEMYNLSCDTRTTTVETLMTLVRCRRCAENQSFLNGRPLGEKGCGLYPLGLTLRQMRRRDDDPVPEGAITYECAEPNCYRSHVPEHMYNVKLGRVLLDSSEAILPFIRCGEHARKIAAKHGKRPCDPGSKVFRLSFTLRRMAEESRKTGG